MKDFPVIKAFINENRYYVYDTYTNKLLDITRDQYFEIVQLQKIGIKTYVSLKKKTAAYEDIMLLLDKGMFRYHFVNEIEHPKTKYLSILIDRRVAGITLQVTQDCNFSCRYCVINNNNNIGRCHKKTDMSWEVAQKSIDFLYNHSKDASVITIAFYGGEPMLNYDLVAKVILYANKRFLTKQIKYMMTINGSILTPKMINFLSENNVDIAISLDGPPEIQNKHRRFGQDGSDTFQTVYNNVRKIQEIDKSYYDKHVSFIPVMFRNEDYQDLINFFATIGKTEKDIHKLDVSLNGIDYLYSEDIDMKSAKYAGYEIEKKDSDFMKLYNDKTQIPSVWHHNGPCLPLERILINTEGVINVCEKVESLKIGNINTGIDLNLAQKYLNIGKSTASDCKTCWAMRFCNMCIMNCFDVENYDFSIERKKENCKRVRSDTLSFFKRCLIFSR